MTGTGRVMCCDASLSNRWRSPPTSIFDETTNATRTRRRRRSRSTETRTLWCHFDRTSLFSIPLARVLSRRIRAIPAHPRRAIPAHPRRPPGGASRLPSSPLLRRTVTASFGRNHLGPAVALGTMTTRTELDRPRPPRDLDPRREEDAPVDPAARPSLRVIDVIALRQMAASGAGAGLGSGSVNATARGGASFSAPVSPGTMRGAGMEAFFEASALCEGGSGATGLAAGT